jgi:hypothetical protein
LRCVDGAVPFLWMFRLSGCALLVGVSLENDHSISLENDRRFVKACPRQRCNWRGWTSLGKIQIKVFAAGVASVSVFVIRGLDNLTRLFVEVYCYQKLWILIRTVAR